MRAYGLRVEELGFAHVLAYDHVLGADPEVHKPWVGPYDVHTTFHEPFVLFGYLAGFTSLEFVTGIIILPQRQTALVAKQAAEVDLLTNGRFRLGVGLGWNAVEYEALGKTFTNRGTTDGRADHAPAPPVDRADGDPRRRVRAGDRRRHRAAAGAAADPDLDRRPVDPGVPPRRPAGRRLVPAGAARARSSTRPAPIVEEAAHEAGRDPAALGMEGRVSWSDAGVDKLVEQVGRWREAGATHVSINTMNAGLGSVDGHLDSARDRRRRARVVPHRLTKRCS